MKHWQRISMIFLTASSFAGTAKAAQVNDSLSVGGGMMLMARQEMTAGSTMNKQGIDVDAAWITAGYKFDDTWSGALSVLSGRWSGASDQGVAFMFLNNAYIAGSGLWGEGSKLTIGMQPTPWFSNIDMAFGAFWFEGYSVGTSGLGVFPFWDNGIRAGGGAGRFSYDFFIHTGEGFAGAGVQGDSATSTGLMAEYKATDALKVTLQYDRSPGGQKAGVPKGAHSTTSAAILLKGMVDVLAEYHSIVGTAATGEGYAAIPRGVLGATGPVNATTYGVQLWAHFGTWGAYARYETGNDDFVNKLGGVSSYPWYNTFPTGAFTAIKSKITVGPTFVLSPKGVFGALLYDTGTLSDTAKADPLNTAQGITTMSALRLQLAAFF